MDSLSLELEIENLDLQRMMKNHQHWMSESTKYQDGYSSSWQDLNMINLEIHALCNWIHPGDEILDIGCNNGFTSFEILNRKKVKIQGIDFCKQAIEYANKRKELEQIQNISFSHGNALNLKIESASYAKAMGVRVLINLPSFELQKQAILEIHRILKPQGLYLMSEAFLGSLDNINTIRKIANLPPLKEPEFNLYLKESDLAAFLEPYFEIKHIDYFSSLYYLGSRFIRDITKDHGNSYLNETNDIFLNLKPNSTPSDFGVQKLYILQKK